MARNLEHGVHDSVIPTGKAHSEPKLLAHPPPGARPLPEGRKRSPSRKPSTCNPPARRLGRIASSVAGSSLAPRRRANDPGANTGVAPSQRLAGLFIAGSHTLVLPPPRALQLGDRVTAATRQDRSPDLKRGADRRSVPYRLDTPSPSTVARRRRRFVSDDRCFRSCSAARKSTAVWPLVRTHPRCRHRGAEPRQPCQTGGPSTLDS